MMPTSSRTSGAEALFSEGLKLAFLFFFSFVLCLVSLVHRVLPAETSHLALQIRVPSEKWLRWHLSSVGWAICGSAAPDTATQDGQYICFLMGKMNLFIFWILADTLDFNHFILLWIYYVCPLLSAYFPFPYFSWIDQATIYFICFLIEQFTVLYPFIKYYFRSPCSHNQML